MIGKTLAHYEILEKLGAGGMGEVYRAHDTKLDRDVAVKVLPLDYAQDQARRFRFEQEARAVAALKHPNIVTIFSVEESNGVHFLTMELLEGQALSRLIPSEGFPLARFFDIAIPLVDAIGCAHTRGIIHRDLKPDNVMVIGERQLKVLDFGLAKRCQPSTPELEETLAAQPQLTQAGTLLGTVAYMSPEQITGGAADARSDVFSLGIIFHELLSGVRPFRGDSPAAILYSIVNDDAPRLRSVPIEVAAILGRCLDKNPEGRYPDAVKLLGALQTVIGTSQAVSVPKGASLTREGQVAFDQGEWKKAHVELLKVLEQRDLCPEELEMLGTCEGWLGEFDTCLRTWEKAYAGYAKTGNDIAAARMALELAHLYIEKNAHTVASGWQRKAERLLKNRCDCIEYGHMLRQQVVKALGRCDFAKALELNERCADVAERFNDRNLQAEALHDRGQILIARGDVEEGRALVDEAMTSAVSGEVSPGTVGDLYCRTMSVCKTLADFKRAREWSEAAARWCEPYPESGFLGICRVHSAETLRHWGRWSEAELAVRSACEMFERTGLQGHIGDALNELGQLALCKGDYVEAESAFRRAHECGHDPVPGLALLRLAQGAGKAAQRMIERALIEDPENKLRRAGLLDAMVMIALANGNVSVAETAADELIKIAEDFECPVFEAQGVMARGALELEQGNDHTAMATLRRALSMFNELALPYDAARTRMLMGRAYLRTGNKEDARLQLDAAVKTLTELGAAADLGTATELMRQLD